MQNYWDRYDWLTRAYAFKCVGAYESQILVDFMDNPSDAAASRHARLYLPPSLSLPLWIYATTGQKTWRSGWWNFMKERRGVSHAAILGHVGKLMWCPPLPPVSSYGLGVRERPPRCLIRYIIRETAGRGCRQLTRGCRGRISCDFLEGWGGFMFRSYVQCFGGLIWYPTESVGGRGSAQSFSVSTTNRIDTRIGDRLSGNIIYPSIKYAPQSSPAA